MKDHEKLDNIKVIGSSNSSSNDGEFSFVPGLC